MAKKTETAAVTLPPKVVPIPTPENVTYNIATLRAVHQNLTAMEGQVQLRLESITGHLREVASTVEQELVAMRIRGLQAPGYELQTLAHHAERIAGAGLGLAALVGQARQRLQAGLAVIEQVTTHLSALQPTDYVQVEYKQTLTEALLPVRLAGHRLAEAISKAEPLIDVGRQCAGRAVQAALLAAREVLVRDAAARLARLREETQRVHAPNAHEQRLTQLVAQVARALEAPLPVARLVWPDGDDPFAPPVLNVLKED